MLLASKSVVWEKRDGEVSTAAPSITPPDNLFLLTRWRGKKCPALLLNDDKTV